MLANTSSLQIEVEIMLETKTFNLSNSTNLIILIKFD